jgi:hypothetical protein
MPPRVQLIDEDLEIAEESCRRLAALSGQRRDRESRLGADGRQIARARTPRTRITAP